MKCTNRLVHEKGLGQGTDLGGALFADRPDIFICPLILQSGLMRHAIVQRFHLDPRDAHWL